MSTNKWKGYKIMVHKYKGVLLSCREKNKLIKFSGKLLDITGLLDHTETLWDFLTTLNLESDGSVHD